MTEFALTPEPKSSPYGAIQTARQIAPGLWSVSTASHGGIQVSRQREAAMPGHLRLSRSWYEEDCEWALVALAFPNDFSPAQVADAILTVCNAYPEAYETHVGVALVAGQSRARDQAVFQAAHVGDYVVRSAFGDWAPWVPKGSVGVYAYKEATNQGGWFIVPAEEYRLDRTGFVVDVGRHLSVEAPGAGRLCLS